MIAAPYARSAAMHSSGGDPAGHSPADIAAAMKSVLVVARCDEFTRAVK
jgi:hypothetical protein